ncbi:MAG TPA: radical SAM protein, partial [Chitinophagaceae bacterium]|nr:radical SAM protein [Chitinophagaceae bacterium]
LTEKDIEALLISLRKLGTKQVVMSGGEALLNPNFFRFCEMLRNENISISLLSTGLTLAKNAQNIVDYVGDVIISIDGPPEIHDSIRNIPGAFEKIRQGVERIRLIDPYFRITSRTVIHKMNFKYWKGIVETGRQLGLDQMSFLPADVSSHAFNREILWNSNKQGELLLTAEDAEELEKIIGAIAGDSIIAENSSKLHKIYEYYAAFHGLNDFPFKKCNAPWVSTVVEADGTVRPCFFHEAIGNINHDSLENILNSNGSIDFRKNLDMDKNETCKKCVCYLNLSPKARLGT